jgi:hypothetical protein
MAATKLNFKDVPSIPNLKVAEDFKTSSGDKWQVLSTGPNTIHFVAAGASPMSSGEITVIGPNVTTIALSFQKLLEAAKKAAGLLSGGGQKCTTTTQVNVGSDGKVTSITTTTVCAPA